MEHKINESRRHSLDVKLLFIFLIRELRKTKQNQTKNKCFTRRNQTYKPPKQHVSEQANGHRKVAPQNKIKKNYKTNKKNKSKHF